MKDVTVLYHPDEITRFSLAPLLLSRHAGAFRFTRSLQEVLERDHNRSLLVLRYTRLVRDRDERRRVLERLRDKYDRIIYFDDSASVDAINRDVLEVVDLYYKKQIARDRESYLKPLKGGRRFRAYYQNEYGIEKDARSRPAIPPHHVDKLRLAWNFGIGIYPRDKSRLRTARMLERRLGPRAMRLALRRPRRLPSHDREAFVSARFDRSFVSQGMACQRLLFAEALRNSPRFRTGRLPREEYNRELLTARATLSPFGWGEVCFRDFEAVWSGSTLVKPAMAYVET